MLKWSDATPEERRLVSNGIGPDYLPGPIRRLITDHLSFFFSEADWAHHDWGYFWGYPDKSECDRLFLSAMLRDASRQDTVPLMFVASVLSFALWYLVSRYGDLSYNWLGPDSAEDKFRQLKADNR